MKDLRRILITGATGFIGSNLVRRLIREDFKTGIIKRQNSDIWRIRDLTDKMAVYDLDLKDSHAVSEAVSHFKPDVIFHLATYYKVDHTSNEISLMIDTNVTGTVNLLEASKDSGIKLFVNTSSCFVYRESRDKLKETDDLSPINLYALTKMQAEQACSFYVEKYGLEAMTFRLFPPYGPADNERRLIPYVINCFLKGERPKLTTGRQRWDFVYVDDIIDAYLKLLSVHDRTQKHEIFNIGTGNVASVREVVSKIKDIIGSELEPDWRAIPHRENEVWFVSADTGRTEKVLKWQPKTKIMEEGLKLTINWYKEFLKNSRRT